MYQTRIFCCCFFFGAVFPAKTIVPARSRYYILALNLGSWNGSVTRLGAECDEQDTCTPACASSQ